MSTTKENKNENVKVNESAKVENESAKVESKQILIDESNESDTYKIKHATEINKRYKSEEPQAHESDKWQHGKLIAIYRPQANRVNSDKTFYKIEYNGIIFDGYTNTEFCDANGIPRTHRGSNTPKVETLLDKLQALKAAIEAVGSTESDFVNFAKIVAKKIESEKLEGERAEFVAKYAAAVKFFPKLTEQDFADENGADELELAKKLGYKFSDTKATDKATDNTPTDNKANK